MSARSDSKMTWLRDNNTHYNGDKKMPEITEYQKSAALLAGDIGTLFNCAQQNPDKAFEFFKKLKSMRDDIISDEKIRNSRYSAMVNVYSAIHSGAIKRTEIISE
jgi:hypothetical protein